MLEAASLSGQQCCQISEFRTITLDADQMQAAAAGANRAFRF
jgi:hypothetical protein